MHICQSIPWNDHYNHHHHPRVWGVCPVVLWEILVKPSMTPKPSTVIWCRWSIIRQLAPSHWQGSLSSTRCPNPRSDCHPHCWASIQPKSCKVYSITPMRRWVVAIVRTWHSALRDDDRVLHGLSTDSVQVYPMTNLWVCVRGLWDYYSAYKEKST